MPNKLRGPFMFSCFLELHGRWRSTVEHIPLFSGNSSGKINMTYGQLAWSLIDFPEHIAAARSASLVANVDFSSCTR